MARRTVGIDSAVLAELEQIARRESKPLERVVSELLAEALAERRARANETPPFDWVSKPMRPRIDLGDKRAIYGALDR